MVNACELLMRGCLHVVDQEEPQILHGMLACDEADAEGQQLKLKQRGRAWNSNPRDLLTELAAGGHAKQG